MTRHMAGSGADGVASGQVLREGAASGLLQQIDLAGTTLATAVGCTGGFAISLLTDIKGLNHCVERGNIVYSENAKHAMLGICCRTIDRHGAASEPVARAMA